MNATALEINIAQTIIESMSPKLKGEVMKLEPEQVAAFAAQRLKEVVADRKNMAMQLRTSRQKLEQFSAVVAATIAK